MHHLSENDISTEESNRNIIRQQLYEENHYTPCRHTAGNIRICHPRHACMAHLPAGRRNRAEGHDRGRRALQLCPHGRRHTGTALQGKLLLCPNRRQPPGGLGRTGTRKRHEERPGGAGGSGPRTDKTAGNTDTAADAGGRQTLRTGVRRHVGRQKERPCHPGRVRGHGFPGPQERPDTQAARERCQDALRQDAEHGGIYQQQRDHRQRTRLLHGPEQRPVQSHVRYRRTGEAQPSLQILR